MTDREVIDKYYELRSCRATGEFFGVCDETIRRLLKKNNVGLTNWKVKKREPRYHCPSVLPYTDEEVIEAYKKYGTQEKTEKALGISQASVYRILKRNHVPADGRRRMKHNGGSPRKITDQELIEESKTMTRSEIAEKHHMCICNVDRKLHRLGIKCVPEYRWCGTKRFQGGKHRQRIEAAGFGAEYEDGITLKRVMKRDGGICKLCGKPVDITDRNGKGIGNKYPTVDHIIPISKGGSHTWQNVQLTHMICNARKYAAEVS